MSVMTLLHVEGGGGGGGELLDKLKMPLPPLKFASSKANFILTTNQR